MWRVPKAVPQRLGNPKVLLSIDVYRLEFARQFDESDSVPVPVSTFTKQILFAEEVERMRELQDGLHGLGIDGVGGNVKVQWVAVEGQQMICLPDDAECWL